MASCWYSLKHNRSFSQITTTFDLETLRGLQELGGINPLCGREWQNGGDGIRRGAPSFTGWSPPHRCLPSWNEGAPSGTSYVTLASLHPRSGRPIRWLQMSTRKHRPMHRTLWHAQNRIRVRREDYMISTSSLNKTFVNPAGAGGRRHRDLIYIEMACT